MKVMSLIPSLFLYATAAIAADDACRIKVNNAAVYEFAQSAVMPVQEEGVYATIFEMTKKRFDNFVLARVVLIASMDPNDDVNPLGFTSYSVRAKQIGSSSDCKITSVERIER